MEFRGGVATTLTDPNNVVIAAATNGSPGVSGHGGAGLGGGGGGGNGFGGTGGDACSNGTKGFDIDNGGLVGANNAGTADKNG